MSESFLEINSLVLLAVLLGETQQLCLPATVTACYIWLKSKLVNSFLLFCLCMQDKGSVQKSLQVSRASCTVPVQNRGWKCVEINRKCSRVEVYSWNCIEGTFDLVNVVYYFFNKTIIIIVMTFRFPVFLFVFGSSGFRYLHYPSKDSETAF